MTTDDCLVDKRPLILHRQRAWIMVWLLTGMTVVSFVDRQVLALLVEDLKSDLDITDLQFGLLAGPAFIVAYNIMLIPLAMLVDRANRKRLLLGGCILWSLMTLASAFAHSFGELLVLRGGLAVGEALLAPIAISLIGDLFERPARALPTVIFVTGSTVGTTSATFFSAMAYQAVEQMHVNLPFVGLAHAWRLTLIAVALPGFVLAAAFAIAGREPKRGGGDPIRDGASVTLRQHLASHGSAYFLVCTAAGCAMLASTGLNIWGPAYLMRRFGYAQVEAGYLLGGVSAVMGVIGLLTFPRLSRLLARGRRIDLGMADHMMISIVVAIPGLLLIGFGGNITTVILGAALALVALASAVALPTQLIQMHTPAPFRGRITAFVLFFLFLISIGVGPVLIPFLAQHLFSGTAALGKALSFGGSIACLIALGLVGLLRQKLRRIDD